MGGFELKIWRRGMNWSQERAAEELGVDLRTYWNWEHKGCSKTVELATKALSCQHLMPEIFALMKKMQVIVNH